MMAFKANVINKAYLVFYVSTGSFEPIVYLDDPTQLLYASGDDGFVVSEYANVFAARTRLGFELTSETIVSVMRSSRYLMAV